MTKPTPTISVSRSQVIDESLTAGIQGPVLLHDHYLIEKLAQFNRERVPERIVHAKGGGAFGELVITHDVSKYTKAAFLQPGRRPSPSSASPPSPVSRAARTPGAIRAVLRMKFYTEEGNYDLVGNNTPVFFIKGRHQVPRLHSFAEATARLRSS